MQTWVLEQSFWLQWGEETGHRQGEAGDRQEAEAVLQELAMTWETGLCYGFKDS